MHIGLATSPNWRVADFMAGISCRRPASAPAIAAASDTTMTMHAYVNPPDFSGCGVVNTAAWRTAQIPSANAHATATGVARGCTRR